MRYILILFVFVVSCNNNNVPGPIEIPDLPNNQSIIVEGVAGSSAEGDTIYSYILNPSILDQGSQAPNPEIRSGFGIGIIVPDSLFEQWKLAHSLLSYIVLEIKPIQPDTVYWHLTEVRHLGYRP